MRITNLSRIVITKIVRTWAFTVQLSVLLRCSHSVSAITFKAPLLGYLIQLPNRTLLHVSTATFPDVCAMVAFLKF